MQFTLTIDGLSEQRANEFSTLIEGHEPSPLAVTLNETDEDQKIWNVVAYFAEEAEAESALARLAALPGKIECSIEALPTVDWVRRSLEGLAPVVVNRFIEAVMKIKAMGISILMAESHLAAATRIGDRLYAIDRGEIIFHGPPKEALANEKVVKALRG